MKNLSTYIRHNPLLRSLFVTQDNKIVIAQPPNAPLWGAGVLFVVSRFAKPPLRRWVKGCYRGLLVGWSVAEIGWGVNLFRKLLGCVVLGIEVVSLRKLFK